jgi:hypothetical protein
MKPQKLSLEAIKNAHAELTDIFEKKNKDYGNSFEESLEKHGIIAAIVRMEDKMLRLSNLSKNQSEQLVKDESIIDTLKDLSNYALMTAVWLEQTQRLQEIDDKIAEYKEVPSTKIVDDDFDMSYFDGYDSKFKNIVQDIIRFEPDLIVTKSITFDNKLEPKYIMIDVTNVNKAVNWFNGYVNRGSYSLKKHYYNYLDESGPGRILISTIKDKNDD